MKYDVFISYSRKDTAVADRICAAFDRAGISYFVDRQDISGGFEFPVVIAEAILDSSIILFLASKDSYDSKFTNAELTFAFNEKPKNSILPYIIDGSTMPPALRFVFSSINWRTIESHPIDTVLVDDVLNLIGRKRHEKTSPVATSASKPVSAPTISPEPVEKTWKVGDYYNVDGKEGVVFWVDKTGKHGKIVSLDQNKLHWCTYEESKNGLSGITAHESDGMRNLQSIMKISDWRNKYPAFAWCADHGSGWYLPALDELKELLLNDDVRDKVNRALTKKGISVMLPGIGEFDHYWSSTEYDKWSAWYVDMCDGLANDDIKEYFSRCVRAVAAF